MNTTEPPSTLVTDRASETSPADRVKKSCHRPKRLFNADGHLLRLVAEADRIRLAHLFDPYLAVHTSRIEPLPHQITAVYEEMLPRQPLRFLLADDPGAGKTIMAGLLIKELLIRSDLERCLVVVPGNLVEQWQDEFASKFDLPFDLLTRDRIEAARFSNPFDDSDRLIARLDMLIRNEDLQRLLEAAKEWDLVVCDEAHRMAASYFGAEIRYTKRYRLGQLLGARCRHFLLMTATPHNGKEEDFQLFMALVDPDRFEGRFRDRVHQSDASDMLRRLTKEELLRFDGRPLFPERRAHTAQYELSDGEAALYEAVTTYVREEMDRAERLAARDETRRRNVGFALQILQRRLASSPAAIHESLRRRRERLESRLSRAERDASGSRPDVVVTDSAPLSELDFDDLEDAAEEDIERTEARVLGRATAAQTIAELEAELDTLKGLETRARELRRDGTDTKWLQLASILDHPLMTDAGGNRRKLIVFTEARDTLEYLAGKIRTRLGRSEAVVVIHGGVGRQDRRRSVEAFMHDPNVVVMVANDAAGEGVNLQRAHLTVNYDLPWNPNRLEQRFGRIHRIGQTEVCHLWNLVAKDTREGEVYARLLEKLETARTALGGRVYDVLGRLFRETEMRDLLMEAIRYGERPQVKARLFERVDGAVERERLLTLLEDRALVRDHLGTAEVGRIREEMERAEAHRLQPHYLDYRPIGDGERSSLADRIDATWLNRDVDDSAIAYARSHLARGHADEVRSRRLPEIDRVEAQVTARLKREIVFWDNRALRLRDDERAGKTKGHLSATQAEMRANALAERLERRRAELAAERDISPLPPVVRGAALVVPAGLLNRLASHSPAPAGLAGVRETTAEGRAEVERLAMRVVTEAERALGNVPRDVSAAKLGYDIESRESGTGRLRFIEVKGRAGDAETVTVTHREIRTALNKPDAWILAIVLVRDGYARETRYLRRPFRAEPDFDAVSVTYNLRELLARAETPE